MIQVLEETFKMASKFSEEEQNILARHWMQEIDMPDCINIIREEMMWGQSFSESQDALEMMADKALKEIREGKAERIGWDEL